MVAKNGDTLKEKFGEAVRRLRKARGLTQEQLSTALGLSRMTIHYIESGKTQTPYYKTVTMLASFFGVKPEQLGVSDELVPRQRKFPPGVDIHS